MRLARPLAAAVAALAIAPLLAHAAARLETPRSLGEAEALVATAGGAERDRALEAWGARAALDEIVFVLRRDARELGGAEGPLCRVALAKAPASNAPLRARLVARLARTNDKGAKAAAAELAARLPDFTGDPRASVFRLAVVAPTRGDYAAYGASLRAGVAAALEAANRDARAPIALESYDSGSGDPVDALLAADSAAARAAAIVGDLLSTSTFPVAAIARARGAVLVSPTATDESVGRAGRGTFQIGPSGDRRAERLVAWARANGVQRFARLASTGANRALADAYEAAVARTGGTLAWRGDYAPGDGDFRGASAAIRREQVEALFWDGESAEAAALLRQLVKDRVSVRIVGGEALAPDRFHADARALLAGVTFVADDWEFDASFAEKLDSAAVAAGETGANAVFVRGWLAGEAIAGAVKAGALTPEALRDALEAASERTPGRDRLGFLALERLGAHVALRTVQRGKAVPLP